MRRSSSGTSDQRPHPPWHRCGGERVVHYSIANLCPAIAMTRPGARSDKKMRPAEDCFMTDCSGTTAPIRDRRTPTTAARVDDADGQQGEPSSSGSALSDHLAGCSPRIAPSMAAKAAGWSAGTELMRPDAANACARSSDCAPSTAPASASAVRPEPATTTTRRPACTLRSTSS